MNNILTAIYGKFTGSAVSADVGGRIYFNEAPEGCEFPYISYFIVSAIPADTFKVYGNEMLIQFSIFSISEGLTEITKIYNDLKSLLNDCSLTITSNTLIYMTWANLVTMTDEMTTSMGTAIVKHWAVDYNILTEAS